ncbi:MAG: phosphoribosylformylglycinamidine synthase subunit PurS [Methanomicrobiales archaeon]|jgi:phosphoribosylformylglycinamidine synthase|nr:phosphoribosylformylglycinamidine synthase subunit PurS [Methanolinea sp.]MCC7468529.1 phosphoribosylformylglycinamidine synthase subunit PurS [Burkholderiaceae bacterium]OPZ43476.1 MAG: phosphoribosylformylglycinamidine synthase subunit PurS [Euryarchaeota archaeon ADurb.BinA087]HNI41386.1 phosphoribosylformylglycinamidine synthase subunit PurS [Methanoregulaceae archaeon]HNL86021.1 phosphoribosylformylglycinamidine synthase subunit PurS [Methanoregulaceae archaeon]
MIFLAKITIGLKEGMLDPEALAIRHALGNLGFATEELRTKKLFLVRFDAADAREAEEKAKGMCERLLANPVIHHFEVEVHR